MALNQTRHIIQTATVCVLFLWTVLRRSFEGAWLRTEKAALDKSEHRRRKIKVPLKFCSSALLHDWALLKLHTLELETSFISFGWCYASARMKQRSMQNPSQLEFVLYFRICKHTVHIKSAEICTVWSLSVCMWSEQNASSSKILISGSLVCAQWFSWGAFSRGISFYFLPVAFRVSLTS